MRSGRHPRRALHLTRMRAEADGAPATVAQEADLLARASALAVPSLPMHHRGLALAAAAPRSSALSRDASAAGSVSRKSSTRTRQSTPSHRPETEPKSRIVAQCQHERLRRQIQPRRRRRRGAWSEQGLVGGRRAVRAESAVLCPVPRARPVALPARATRKTRPHEGRRARNESVCSKQGDASAVQRIGHAAHSAPAAFSIGTSLPSWCRAWQAVGPHTRGSGERAVEPTLHGIDAPSLPPTCLPPMKTFGTVRCFVNSCSATCISAPPAGEQRARV